MEIDLGEVIRKHKIFSGLIFLILVGILFSSSPNNLEGNTTGSIVENIPEEQIKIEKEIIYEEPVEEILEIDKYFLVTRIIDGDTIELSNGEKIRLVCIDTPERGEKGYSEATDYIRNLILNEEVKLIKDISEKDRYGRLLRYIYLDEIFVNELIAYNGYGKSYPYSPDISKCSIIQNAEKHAKDNNLGIWKEEVIVIEEENSVSNLDIDCSFNAYNCGDFSSCSEVMDVFDSCDSDINDLDRDDDGIPCESLCG